MRLGASFVRFEKEMCYGAGHLEFAGSKLFFTREPEARAVGLGPRMPVPGGTEGEEEEDEDEEDEEEDGSDGCVFLVYVDRLVHDSQSSETFSLCRASDSSSGDFLPRK